MQGRHSDQWPTMAEQNSRSSRNAGFAGRAPRRFWWVNQNQTYKEEVGGGFLWSPKTKKNGARNHFYDTMKDVAPGDVIFSFCDTRIKAIGIATTHAET